MLEELTRDLVLLTLRDRVFVGMTVFAVALLVTSLLGASAIVLLHVRADRRAERWEAARSNIEPVLLDVLAGDGEIEALHARIETRHESRFIELLLDRYAKNLRGDELDVVRDVAAPYLDSVATRMSHPDPEMRARSVDALATLGMGRYEDLVAQALGDPSPAVAILAARALAEQTGSKYAERIMDAATRFSGWSPTYVSSVLASMGAGAEPTIRDRYVDSGLAPEIRAICADVLRRIGGAEAADTASMVLEGIEHLEGDEGDKESGEVPRYGDQREVVIESLRILGERGHGDHVALVRAYTESSDPVVRAIAISALGRIGGESDRSRLAEAVRDPSRWVALHAAQSLRELRGFVELERVVEDYPDRAALAREVIEG